MRPIEMMIHLNEAIRRMGLASKLPIAGLVAITPGVVALLLHLPFVGILYFIPGGLFAAQALLIVEPVFNLSAELARQGVDGPQAFAAMAFVGGIVFWWVVLLWMWRQKRGSTKRGSQLS